MPVAPRHRHFWPVSIAAGSILLTMVTFPAYVAWTERFNGSTAKAGSSIQLADDGHDHDHTDPKTKNAVSRAETSAETKDPTTRVQAAANSLTVQAQRNEPDPTLVPSATPAARATVPGNRYAMAGGCYAIRAPNGKWLIRSGSGYAATGATLQEAEPFHFQATDLGTYLLFGKGKTFLSKGDFGGIEAKPKASAAGDWTVTQSSFGADINGLGAQGNPRGAGVADKVTYPLTGLGGVSVDRQVSGQRTYDINVDGVSHYGLYPDWIEDLRRQAGQDIVDDMARGAEAYLQMWERAEGVGNDACRDPRALKRDAIIKAIRKGTTTTGVLQAAGQPHSRLDKTFAYCATTSSGKQVTLKVVFTAGGTVSKVS